MHLSFGSLHETLQVKRQESHSRTVQWNPWMTGSNNKIPLCPVKFPIPQSNRISVNMTNLYCRASNARNNPSFYRNLDFNLLSDIWKLLLQQEKHGLLSTSIISLRLRLSWWNSRWFKMKGLHVRYWKWKKTQICLNLPIKYEKWNLSMHILHTDSWLTFT